MVKDLREINRILIAIQQLSVNEYANKNDVENTCTQIVLGASSPNHSKTIDFCIAANIISEFDDQLFVSPFGKKLLNANPDHNWDLTSEQKTLLIQNCFLDGFYKDDSLDLIKRFSPDARKQTFVFLKKDEFLLRNVLPHLQLLLQVGLVLENDIIYFLKPDFSQHFSYFVNKRKMSYAELEQKLQSDKETGEIAERIVYNFEKNRLKKLNATSESALVKIISGIDVSAGYDLESFDGKTSDLEFNRHIEVKGSTNYDLSFYLSSGELETSQELKNNYWIYFVSGINRQNHTYDGKITLIQNFYKKLNEKNEYNSKPVKYHITKNEEKNLDSN